MIFRARIDRNKAIDFYIRDFLFTFNLVARRKPFRVTIKKILILQTKQMLN